MCLFFDCCQHVMRPFVCIIAPCTNASHQCLSYVSSFYSSFSLCFQSKSICNTANHCIFSQLRPMFQHLTDQTSRQDSACFFVTSMQSKLNLMLQLFRFNLVQQRCEKVAKAAMRPVEKVAVLLERAELADSCW